MTFSKYYLNLLISLLMLFNSCANDEEMNINSNSSGQVNTLNSNNNSSNNSSTSNSGSVINQSFECGNGYYYLLKPEPSESDNTHKYYEYEWQSNPPVCVNVYESELLGGRDESEIKYELVKEINLP